MSANRIHEKAYHDALKRDPERFARECTFIGTCDDGDGGRLALYNCRCSDTLAIPVKS